MGWLKNLFSSGRSEKIPDLQRVIQVYGDVLASGTSVERDIAELPYSKSIIESSILEAIKLTTDETMKQHFSKAFVQLADFQELSVNEKSALDSWNGALTGSVTDTSSDKVSARMIAESGEVLSALRKRILKESEERLKRIQTEVGDGS